MARFAQGDLLENPPFLYSRATAHAIWNIKRDDGADVALDAGHPELGVLSAEYGIISTQTCDVVDPSCDQPWIHVAPVYRVPEDYTPKGHLYRLTSTGLPDGVWVADLRLEAPLEKSVLVGRDPISGFETEPDAIAFALALGRRRDRAALHDHINDILYAAWTRKINNSKPRARRLLPEIHAVRLAIASGSRREPLAVRLYFVSKPELHGFSEETAEWLESWWDTTRVRAADATPALNLLANRYLDGDALNVALYDGLIPLDWISQTWMKPPPATPEGAREDAP